jgi:GTPase SAR1 family protein
MEDIFVTDIHINKFNALCNIDIPLSATSRKHLIITGLNGSGKTCLLETLRDNLTRQHNVFSTSERSPQFFSEYPENSLSLSFNADIPNSSDIPILYFSVFRSKISKPKRGSSEYFLDYLLSISDNDQEMIA